MSDSRLTPDQERQLAEFRRQAAEDRNRLTEEQIVLMRRLEDLERGIVDSLERQKKNLQDNINLLTQEIDQHRTLNELGINVVGAYERQLEQQRQNLELQKLNLDINAADYKQKLKTIAEEQRAFDLKRRAHQESEGFIKRFTGITREPTSTLGKIFQDPGAWAEGMSAGFSETVDSMSIMTSTVDKIVEASVALALAQDQAVVSFRKNTGATGEFDDNIRGLERSLFTAGVTTDEASAAVQNLYVNVSDFTMMSEEQQAVLGKTVAVLNELGVSAATSSKNIQFATKVLGMSATQAGKLQRDLLTFAKELGVSVEQIAGDFATMGPQIAALGSKGVGAFKALAAQAKSTGLQMQDLLNLTSKFDKFDTAAQSVGSLNALLGGPYLNTLELVAETDPSKRMEILKKRVDAAGLSFNSMDYYQRKALASAMGLNEAQLAMFMQGDLNKITPTTKSAEELIALQNQTAQFNTVMEELTQTFQMFAIEFGGPLISVFKSFFQLLQMLAIPIKTLVIAFMAYQTVTKGVILYETIKNAQLALSNSTLLANLGTIYAYTIGSQGLAGVIPFVTSALQRMGIAANSSLGIYGALAAAALYLAYVFFVKTHSPGLIDILYMAAAGFIALGIASTIFGFSLGPVLPFILGFAGALLMVGAASLMVGTGIGMAAAGMSLFVNSLTGFATGLAESMTQTALAIQDIVESINELDTVKTVALGAAMVPLAAAAPAAALAATAAVAVGTAASAVFGGGEKAPAAAGAGGGGISGPPPVININLQIDSTEFKAVVNEVSVEKYSGGKPSEMYASIIDMIQQGVVRGT